MAKNGWTRKTYSGEPYHIFSIGGIALIQIYPHPVLAGKWQLAYIFGGKSIEFLSPQATSLSLAKQRAEDAIGDFWDDQLKRRFR